MVVQSSFSLQLVDAETQQPLNEYRGPSGTVYYAEARPNGEYFLRFHVLGDNAVTAPTLNNSNGSNNETATATAISSDEMIYFRPSVDGKDLGFYTNLSSAQGARDVGLWTFVNGIGTNQAFKFETATVINNSDPQVLLSSTVVATTAPTNPSSANTTRAESSTDTATSPATKPESSGPPKLYMGNVQVQISKAVFTGNQKRVYTSLPPLTKDETVVAALAAPISASSSLHEAEDNEVVSPATASDIADGPSSSGTVVDPSSVSAASSHKTESNDENPAATATSTNQDPVPILRSREGSQRFQEKFTEECPTYKPGELLETITIHYGSTAALIQAGILVPVGGLIPQFVGVPPAATAAVVTATNNAAETTTAPPLIVPQATEVVTNTAPLNSTSLPATNSTLEAVTVPAALATGLVINPIARVVTAKEPADAVSLVDPTSSANKRVFSVVEKGSKTGAAPPSSKKVCRDANTKEPSSTTRAAATVSVSTTKLAVKQ